MERQVGLARWGAPVMDLLKLSYLDAPFPAEGPSTVQGFFEPPFYEWYRTNNDFTEFYQVEECISYISDYMKSHGPFDGLMGFSQGAFLAGQLAGYQRLKEDLLPTPIKFVILIGGGMSGYKPMSAAYDTPIKCPSLHTIGRKDFNRPAGETLVTKFENPVILRHPHGHRVPELDNDSIAEFRSFLLKMLALRDEDEDPKEHLEKST
ncbi:hypothetical protein SELMODRAFT_271081 [Selaginella moellendorffii]|uniref:Serine hydrolase domain-containing protein n=2 Tax=Selaginella moellendorffii TaxID=88036 RepID=D8RTT2_SELML|nr:hypothetical protein SELMODRAFT_271081 [Selaginella moellendorffii]